MREILFRGKRVDNGEWVDGCLINKDGNTFIIQNDSDYWHPVIPETVGQYTGLDDKNGVKIFEGDLLLNVLFGDLWECKFTSAMFALELIGDGMKEPLGWVEGFGVIGNIHTIRNCWR